MTKYCCEQLKEEMEAEYPKIERDKNGYYDVVEDGIRVITCSYCPFCGSKLDERA